MIRTFYWSKRKTKHVKVFYKFLSRGHKVEAVVHFSKLTPMIYAPTFFIYSIQIIDIQIK